MPHKPDPTRMPKPLQSLEWQPMTEKAWLSTDELLVAVPIKDQRPNPQHPWVYEFAVVQISCDEDYFEVNLDGEIWGWELSDCDYYVLIR